MRCATSSSASALPSCAGVSATGSAVSSALGLASAERIEAVCSDVSPPTTDDNSPAFSVASAEVSCEVLSRPSAPLSVPPVSGASRSPVWPAVSVSSRASRSAVASRLSTAPVSWVPVRPPPSRASSWPGVAAPSRLPSWPDVSPPTSPAACDGVGFAPSRLRTSSDDRVEDAAARRRACGTGRSGGHRRGRLRDGRQRAGCERGGGCDERDAAAARQRVHDGRDLSARDGLDPSRPNGRAP